MAHKIMIQGTGSGRGKSLMVCLLCRILRKQGYSVAPLKTINFTAVTYKKNGLEFGYSQALQAVSAKIEPDPIFNPITPKPWIDGTISIFIYGRKVADKIPFSGNDLLVPKKDTVSSMFAEERLEKIVRETLQKLEEKYDIIVLEGSGPIKSKGLGAMSKALEFANMRVAEIADTPVLMIASRPDAARGMLSLLTDREIDRIKGLIINPYEFFKIAEEIGAEITPELAFKYGESVFGDLGKEIVAVLPHIKELDSLPELDPVQPAPTIPLDLWDVLVDKISEKIIKYIDIEKIYRIMGL